MGDLNLLLGSRKRASFHMSTSSHPKRPKIEKKNTSKELFHCVPWAKISNQKAPSPGLEVFSGIYTFLEGPWRLQVMWRELVLRKRAEKGKEEGVEVDRRQMQWGSGRPPSHRKCIGRSSVKNNSLQEGRASQSPSPALLLTH